MRCKDVLHELAGYLYGETEERERVEDHLKVCPSCREALSGMRDTLKLVDRRRRREVGPWFWERYLSKLRFRVEEEKKWRLLMPAPVVTFVFFLFLFILFAMILIRDHQLDPEMFYIAENLEVVENLELLDNFDLIISLDLNEVKR
jgi:predicted anti-sigma-YlaC factor YlaD